MKFPALKRFIIAHEGSSDLRRIKTLLRCALSDDPEDITKEESARLESVESVVIKSIAKLAEGMGLPPFRGSYGAASGNGDAPQFRQFSQLLQAKKWGSAGTLVIWMRDTDGHFNRKSDVMHVRDELPPTNCCKKCVFAVAHECSEAWIFLGAHQLRESREAQSIKLGFSVFTHPQNLSHKENVPKSAKDILKKLGVTRDNESSFLRVAWSEVNETDCTGLGAFKQDILIALDTFGLD